MGKNKLKRFAENETFDFVFQPSQREAYFNDFELKGKWNEFFKNNHPITLELGCGGGEYTVGLAQDNPNRNFIGLDIKGARFWKGAKFAFENKMNNVAFVRTRLHAVKSFFSNVDNINELWITFPDPQPRESKEEKRLTSPEFLDRYRSFCSKDCIVNLKTDSDFLYDYTLNEVVKIQNLKILELNTDVRKNYTTGPLIEITTFYEKMWLEEGRKIHYLKFNLFP